MASQDWFEKDFYAILGVPPDADDATIKKTYRRLARQLHPDHNQGDPAAEHRFKEIGEAYGVLSDPEQRRTYDAVRSMSRGGARFTAGGPSSGGGSGGFEDVFTQMFGASAGAGGTRFSTAGGPYGSYGGGGGAGQPSLDDILNMFTSGGGTSGSASSASGYPGFGFQGTAGPRRGADLTARTALSFREAVNGATVTLTTSSGARITTRIPPGVRDGQKIRLRGKGGKGEAGAPDGDLILTISVGAHPVFGRDGADLTVDLPVTFAEATLGATVSVPTLEGEPVKVRIVPGTPSGRVLRVKGRGVPRKEGAGDLLAKVHVIVPQTLSDEVRTAVEALRSQEHGEDPRAELFARARQG